MKTVKVLMIGDSGVGKSSLMLRLTCDRFDEDIGTTIGIDFKVKLVQLGSGESIHLQLWDTAGQERFRTLTASYYRGAHAVALVYDVNDATSFTNLQRWLDEVRTFCSDDVTLLLIGNKVDVGGNQNRADAVAFAKEHHMLVAFCSAKTKEGVGEAFDELARKVCDRANVAVSSSSVNLQRSDGAKNDHRSCC